MNQLEKMSPEGVENNRVEIMPDESHSPEEFNRNLAEYREHLISRLDRSERINSLADKLAWNNSPEELLKAKKNLGDPETLEAAYRDAVVGDHSQVDGKELAEMRNDARENWIHNQIDSHVYDLALERLGWSPDAATPDDTSVNYIPVDYPSSGNVEQPIDQVVKNAEFQTHPASAFSPDEGDQDTSGMKNDLAATIHEAGTVPAPLNNREVAINGIAGQMVESGDNLQKREVQAGESFIRICANDDSGRSPYFTSMKEIDDIAYRSPDGGMILNEDRFRDRFSLPENSKLEQCEIYSAKENFSAYASKIAPSSEFWGQVRHPGGGEQILFADRSHLEKEESLPVTLCSDEEFNKRKTGGSGGIT